jgi:hypothetical protein
MDNSENFFIKSGQTPIVVTIKLPREVSSFSELQEVAASLSELEKLYHRARRRWPFPSDAYNPRINSHLASFKVSSPPELVVVIDPAWLAVFISMITVYKPAKDSLRELSNDIRSIVDAIRGLTVAQIEDLKIAVTLARDGIQEMELNVKPTMRRKLTQYSERLLGKDGGDLRISVKRLDD